MGAEEPGSASLVLGGLAPADDREGDDRGDAHQRKEVLDDAEERPVADDGELEGGREEGPEALNDRQDEDAEPPEDGRVGEPGCGPAQQFSLGDDFDDFGLGDLGGA